MDSKEILKLQGVADTLFIPLVARIYISKRLPEYFYDAMALSLEKHLPDESIQKSSSEYAHLASVARYYNLDSMTKNFLAAHERCNVINLGAGLETAYFRLNSQNAVFYEMSPLRKVTVEKKLVKKVSKKGA